MRQIVLLLLIITHWAISAISSFYIYVRSNSTYDWLYFSVICSVIASWTLTGNECLISYWEKLCIDPHYVFDSDPSLPFVSLIFGNYSNIITFLLIASTVYNLFAMMTIYKVPIILKATFIYLMIFPMIKFRIEKFLNEK